MENIILYLYLNFKRESGSHNLFTNHSNSCTILSINDCHVCKHSHILILYKEYLIPVSGLGEGLPNSVMELWGRSERKENENYK